MVIIVELTKNERRKRVVDDFKKIFGEDNVDAVEFAENIPDELLDKFEDMGYSGSRKIKISIYRGDLETKEVKNEK